MNPFASYRAINTKIRAKERTLLKDEEWEKALQLKTVFQVIEFLKKREGYSDLTPKQKIEEFHRGELEVLLTQYIVREIEDMLHYFSGSYKEFFKVFLMKYEINDLQLILRTISRHEDMENIHTFFVHSEKYSLCQYNKLLNSKNTEQFIEALKGTIYYDALKTMTQEDIGKREFHMEMKLYILLYKTLMEKIERLEVKDQKIAKEIIGTEADLINVQWIFRATKYFDITPEETLIYSLPFGNKMTYTKLKSLSYAKNLEEFKMLAQKYLSYPLFEKEEEAYLDRAIDKYIYDCALYIDKEGEHIASALAYIFILGIEVKDLIALTEGVRYALTEQAIKKYLVHSK